MSAITIALKVQKLRDQVPLLPKLHIKATITTKITKPINIFLSNYNLFTKLLVVIITTYN